MRTSLIAAAVFLSLAGSGAATAQCADCGADFNKADRAQSKGKTEAEIRGEMNQGSGKQTDVRRVGVPNTSTNDRPAR